MAEIQTVTTPAKQESGENCACPCGHDIPIMLRSGYILCSIGREKLCPECVSSQEDGKFVCHRGHS